MSVSKDGKFWRCQFYYKDWQGERKKKNKRGFRTKNEAEQWERDFRQQHSGKLSIRFDNFVEAYMEDMKHRLREHTMINKEYIINLKIVPYFKNRNIDEITTADIRAWQNELMGQGYSQTYLKTVNNQLAAIFNYAERYYDLKSNPCRKAGSMGKSDAELENYWTVEEFNKFLECISDKEMSRAGFLLLYWTGMRIGELLALTYADIDYENCTVNICKSYQRLNRKDVVTEPKTPRSKRIVTIPEFLRDELEEYCSHRYGIVPTERMFDVTKYYFEHEMKRGVNKSGVKKIRIHDLRHSAASLMVSLGFQPLEIADRLGHERIETTLNTYSHLYPNKQAELAARLNAVGKEAGNVKGSENTEQNKKAR